MSIDLCHCHSEITMKSRTIYGRSLPYQLETQRQTLRLRYGCYVLFDSTTRPMFYKQRRLLASQRGLIACLIPSVLFLAVYAIARPLVMADPTPSSPAAQETRRF